MDGRIVFQEKGQQCLGIGAAPQHYSTLGTSSPYSGLIHSIAVDRTCSLLAQIGVVWASGNFDSFILLLLSSVCVSGPLL